LYTGEGTVNQSIPSGDEDGGLVIEIGLVVSCIRLRSDLDTPRKLASLGHTIMKTYST
jgi:hypothetical protein